MPEEKRKISPVVVVAGGVGLALAGILLLFAIGRPKGEPPEPPPGLANLYGKVTDSVTGAPVSGALVGLNGMETLTDGVGNYLFEDLEPGGYILQFSKEGYETAVY